MPGEESGLWGCYVLQLVGITKRYGDVVALDGAGFEARRGRIVGFLGPNGAGKTTAMRCIFGLAVPDAGTITWDGAPVDADVRIGFGYMPEERGLYPKMRVRDQLMHFARLSGRRDDAARRADGWLERLGLADRADAKVEQLSHGNQQRIQLAVALLHEPDLLVLDEPFSGLDPLGAEALTQVLREQSERGAAIVFSSHQLDLVEDVCEDVVIVNRGRVVLTGSLERLRSEAATRRLDVVVDGEPWAPDAEGVREVVDNGRSRYVVDADADLDGLLAAARTAGRVDKFSFEPPHLSDLFREAVRS